MGADVRNYDTDEDPHSLRHLGSAPFAIFRVAMDNNQRLGKAIDRVETLASLRRLSVNGPFHIEYVSCIALKFLDPRGHGVNSDRLKGAALARFREQHPEYFRLSDAMVLFLMACIWWIRTKGIRSSEPGMPLITTSDLDHLLWQMGLLKRERAAVIRIIVRRPRKH